MSTDAEGCPHCGSRNDCRIAKACAEQGPCWCEASIIPTPLQRQLAKLYPRARLCRECLNLVAGAARDASADVIRVREGVADWQIHTIRIRCHLKDVPAVPVPDRNAFDGLSSVAVHSIVHLVQTDLGDGQLLTLTGRLDAEAVPELEQRCARLIESQTRTLMINVGALDYLSSRGLRSLLSTGKSLQRQNGKLVLVAPAGPVRQIIQLAGFDNIFPVCETVDEAVKQTTGRAQILHTKERGADVLTVSGRVDAERAPELEAAGRRILEREYSKLIINLSAVQYLSSAGLCALLKLAKLAKARQSLLILCGPAPAVLQVLKLSGFDKILPISEELSEAMAL